MTHSSQRPSPTWLPLELRSAIWKLTLEPRTLEIKFAQLSELYASSRVPIALHVCRESRDLLLPLYPTTFYSAWHLSGPRVHFGLDTIYLTKDTYKLFFLTAGAQVLDHVRYLAIDHDCQLVPRLAVNRLIYRLEFQMLQHIVESMENLEELTIAFDAEPFFGYCRFVGERSGPVQFHDTLPVDQLASEELRQLDLGIAWDDVDCLVAGRASAAWGRFGRWRLTRGARRKAVFTTQGQRTIWEVEEGEI